MIRRVWPVLVALLASGCVPDARSCVAVPNRHHLFFGECVAGATIAVSIVTALAAIGAALWWIDHTIKMRRHVQSISDALDNTNAQLALQREALRELVAETKLNLSDGFAQIIDPGSTED